MPSLEAEIAAFEQMKVDLETEHKGKWAVVRDGHLVGTFDTLDNAAEEAVRQFGRGPYLIRQIGAPPVTLPASVLFRPVREYADH